MHSNSQLEGICAYYTIIQFSLHELLVYTIYHFYTPMVLSLLKLMYIVAYIWPHIRQNLHGRSYFFCCT